MTSGQLLRRYGSMLCGLGLAFYGQKLLAAPLDQPFVSLARAYAERSAAAAAQTYTDTAEVIYAYDGAPIERYEGRTAIEGSFADLFEQIESEREMNLNFRIIERQGLQARGVYRLRIGPTAQYGLFDVAQNPDGLFISDRSSSAVQADFEEAAGPVLINPDSEELDPGYYRLLTGRYRLPSGCLLVVTRSVVRLFVRDTCDQSWRGLQRQTGLDWTAGSTVLSDQVEASYRFARVTDEPSAHVFVQRGADTVQAVRETPYTLEDVTFASADGVTLAGTLYAPPSNGARLPAVVLVHGSGPQDRDGYASIIAVLADALASEGRIVLTYDKRGSGESGGDGDNAGFDVLAADARASMAYLRNRYEVDVDRVGLAGSSQAGWVIATAIAQGATPTDVFLLGAAGAAFSVREQNLYNTEVRMTCEGVPPELRRLALDQQSAFFDAVADRSRAGRLDQLTREAAAHVEIADWLFPDSSGLDEPGAWFSVLDPDFDPLPVWRAYGGRVVLAFSAYDDATDTAGSLARLGNATTVLLPDSQHLGLNATDVCDADFGGQTNFSPLLFETIAAFASSSP